jgi:hypothetical protein
MSGANRRPDRTQWEALPLDRFSSGFASRPSRASGAQIGFSERRPNRSSLAAKEIKDVGQRVEVVYEDCPNEGFTLPKFKIVD